MRRPTGSSGCKNSGSPQPQASCPTVWRLGVNQFAGASRSVARGSGTGASSGAEHPIYRTRFLRADAQQQGLPDRNPSHPSPPTGIARRRAGDQASAQAIAMLVHSGWAATNLRTPFIGVGQTGLDALPRNVLNYSLACASSLPRQPSKDFKVLSIHISPAVIFLGCFQNHGVVLETRVRY